ncbi:type II toxin-antitoxin system VapC family toxin [Methylobacterium sp. NEAU 140]|uniref:type II toxin-antitoxin system VapC family toxin n=1 Tax=Methylobacterium sp. NEAU 140 TaxID=3064945 RepID=UPI002736B2DC|nr:type II toxin-antitoxin system VapC family toxin [Methylobacterium sp. NEAU 140]MDP4023070.1 type II toxin-antitoxin system VapC family toxin [Methylobacterium sp. NEAU 140]
MIAIDTSAILAVLLAEPEEEAFDRLMATKRMLVGAPTLVEARLSLERRFSNRSESALRRFLTDHSVDVISFNADMFDIAIDAFARYGKGRGHPARLNFGDCLSYAVAKAYAAPLLFKGADFIHTDLVPACDPAA